MAGSGETTTYVDSKTYHQTILDDYNSNVIVPKSLLIDTADAIRLKKNGSKEILIDDFTGDYITGGIEPVDFAAAISALETGGSGGISFDALGAAMINAGSMPTTSSGYFKWYGDIRKYLCIIQLGTNTYSGGGSFCRGYMYFLNDLYDTSKYVTYGSSQYVPVRQIASSVASGNSYFKIFTGYMIPLSSLAASYNKSDNQTFTASIMDTRGSGVTQQYNLAQWGMKIPDIII